MLFLQSQPTYATCAHVVLYWTPRRHDPRAHGRPSSELAGQFQEQAPDVFTLGGWQPRWYHQMATEQCLQEGKVIDKIRDAKRSERVCNFTARPHTQAVNPRVPGRHAVHGAAAACSQQHGDRAKLAMFSAPCLDEPTLALNSRRSFLVWREAYHTTPHA